MEIFDIKPMRPLILAVAAKMDAKETAKSFGFLTSLGVRLLVASTTRSGSVSTPLANTAKKVYDGSIKSASDLKKALGSITPSDTEFRGAFAITRVSTATFARYYLRALEMTAKGEKEPWYGPLEDTAIINLEHVLPKKPEGKWPRFSDDDVTNYVNRLGNLALMQTSKNSNLRSADFATKKQVYADSPYVLTSQIAELEDWTPGAITSRQSKMAELSVKTWPI
ncbi:MAG: HNH endonuclease family protein [Chloroflexi bacterium]|nr:HNH endonuclease family protein [Chloroflexota bacterium]